MNDVSKAACVCNVQGLPGIGVRMVVGSHVHPRNQSQALCKSNKGSSELSYLPSPTLALVFAHLLNVL